jgi:type I restriction enzyme R subunit
LAGFHKVPLLEDAACYLVDKKVNGAVDDAVEKVNVNDDLKKRYLSLASQVVRLYKAVLSDPVANEFVSLKTCLAVLAEKLRSFLPKVSIDDVMVKVGELLAESIAAKGYVLHAT